MVAHDNPTLKVESSTVVNDPKTIAQQKRMVAVNTALEVDLVGNTNAEELEGRVVSAPGGQVNFMQGASMAKDGKAVLAMRSLNKFGGSTIVSKLQGTVVTTPSNFVDHVVTEWGATLRAPAPIRAALADGALQGRLITAEQHQAIVASVPAGTVAEFVQVPPIAPRP